MSRIAYVAVVTIAILILVGKDNTHALSAEAVGLFREGGQLVVELLKKAVT
jgi:hypothetical protein